MRHGRSSRNNGLSKAATLLLLLLGAQIMSAQYWKPVLQDSIGDEVDLKHEYNQYHGLYHDTVNNEFFVWGWIYMLDSNQNSYNSHSVLRYNRVTQKWDTIDKRNDVPFPGDIGDMIWYKGRYYATGSFRELGSLKGKGRYAYYEGGKWHQMDPRPKGGGNKFLVYQDTLYIGGSMYFSDNVYSPGVVKFDGTDFYAFRPFLDTSGVHGGPNIWDIVRFREMFVLAGSMRENLPGDISYPLMIYQNGTKFMPEGFDVSIYSSVGKVLVYQDNLYVVGSFVEADGASFTNHIVMWDGENWYELGEGCDGYVYDMMEYHGDLIVTGIFNHCDCVYSPYIIKWNGKQWCSFTNDSLNNRINDVEVYDDTLYVAGNFDIFGKEDTVRYVAKWAGGDSVIECGPVHYIGVQQPEGQNEVKLEVRPNPTEGILQVQSGSNMTRLELRNLQGQMLYEKRLNSVQDYTLDLSGLSPSIYVLSVVTEEGTTVRKVVKK